MSPIKLENYDNLEISDLIMIYLPYTLTKNNRVRHYKRPAVVLALKDQKAIMFRCTTKHDGKPAAIQAQYYPIEDWEGAGLDRPTYIDVGRYYTINMDAILRQKPLGKLPLSDQFALIEFLKQWRANHG